MRARRTITLPNPIPRHPVLPLHRNPRPWRRPPRCLTRLSTRRWSLWTRRRLRPPMIRRSRVGPPSPQQVWTPAGQRFRAPCHPGPPRSRRPEGSRTTRLRSLRWLRPRTRCRPDRPRPSQRKRTPLTHRRPPPPNPLIRPRPRPRQPARRGGTRPFQTGSRQVRPSQTRPPLTGVPQTGKRCPSPPGRPPTQAAPRPPAQACRHNARLMQWRSKRPRHHRRSRRCPPRRR